MDEEIRGEKLCTAASGWYLSSAPCVTTKTVCIYTYIYIAIICHMHDIIKKILTLFATKPLFPVFFVELDICSKGSKKNTY